jgi:hypothetical protein
MGILARKFVLICTITVQRFRVQGSRFKVLGFGRFWVQRRPWPRSVQSDRGRNFGFISMQFHIRLTKK